MFQRERTQFGALVRAFFARFFENEIGGTGDLKATYFWLLSFLAAPGFLLPILIAFGWSRGTTPDGWSSSENWGWNLVAHHQGVEALRAVSLADKTLALGFAIAATGSVAALVWNSLLPDRRDALVLGALPVRAGTVVLSRLVALAAYVAIVAVGMNLLASFSFGVLLAAGNTFAFAVRGVAAHFVASVSASLFVFAAIVAVQGILLAAGGARLFARVSPVLQTILVGLVAIGFLTLPVVREAAGETVRGTGAAEPWVLWTPALWFLGLYEWMLGTDNVVLVHLARTGAIALGAAAATALAVFPLAYRRLVLASIEHGEHARVSRRARGARVVAMVVSRDPMVRAVSEFFLTTLVRVDRHRFVLAAAIGLTLAWAVAGGGAALFAQPVAPRVDLLSLPFAAVVFLVAGMRIAADLPSTLAPSWMFDQVVPTARQNRAALERTMAIVVVLPIAAGSAALAGRWWGVYAAIVHAAVLLAAAYVIVQRFVGRFGSVPCTRPWAPGHANLRKWWPAYLLAFSAMTTGVATIDWVFLTGIVAPASAPIRPALSLAVPLAVTAIAGIGWSIRQRALESVSNDDAGGLDVLTEAIRSGAHGSTALETSAGCGEGQRRGVGATAGVLFAVSRQDERDRWLDGFNLRPDELWRDLRLALRRSSQAPGFAAFSVITLALGIGVTTAVTSLVIAVVARPMNIRDPESVVAIRSSNQARIKSLSWPDFQDLTRQQASFSAVEGFADFPASLSANGTSLVNGQLVTGGFFEMLGVQAAHGRTIQPADDRPDSPRVAVLSEWLWRTRFARDPAIIGQHVRVGGQAYEVVGVAPRTFRGIGTRAQQPGVWIAMSHPTLTDPALTAYLDRSARDRGYLNVVARLRQPDSRRAALSEVAAIGDRLDRDAPVGPSRMWTTAPIDDNQWLRAGQVYGAIVVLLPVLVLLIACTNLANLVLSRSASRRHEFAVRRALGSSRWSLVRGEIVEHGLLAVVGAAGGLLVAHVLIMYVLAFVQGALGYAPRYQIDARIDPMALTVAIAAAVLSVIVSGLAPAIRLTSDGHGRVLGSEAAGTMSPRRFGQRRLVAGQVAASLALLLVAALCLRQAFTIAQEERVTGDLSDVGVVAVALPLRTHDAVEVDEIVGRILLEAARAGGLSAVAATTGFHAFGSERVDTTTVDRPLPLGTSDRSAALAAASPGIFRVLGLRFLSGQPYDDTHTRSGPRVAVISESQARALFGTTDAADREFLFRRSGESATYAARVTGVVTDAGRDPRTGAPLQDIYVPFTQRFDPDARFTAWPIPIVGRPASGNASAAAARLATAVRRADPDLAVHSAGSAAAMAGGTSPVFGLVVQSTTGLAILALALSMSGLYSVMSHLVSGRRRELGIRLALGARRGDIVRLVVSEGIRPVAHGVGIGLVVAAIVRLAMQPLFRASSSAIDPAAVVIAVVPLAVAAAVACYLPARRAARVDPSVTLRES